MTPPDWLTPISPHQVKYVDLLRPAVLGSRSAAAEVDSGRVRPSQRSSFPDLAPVTDAAPNTC